MALGLFAPYQSVLMPIKDPVKRAERHKQYIRERYHSDAEYRRKHKALVRRNSGLRSAEIRQEVAQFKAAGCALCDERDPCCLTAHHVDPAQKRFAISEAPTRKVGRAKFTAELAKCVCLCENCHRKVHAGRKALPAQLARPEQAAPIACPHIAGYP